MSIKIQDLHWDPQSETKKALNCLADEVSERYAKRDDSLLSCALCLDLLGCTK